MNPDAKNLDSTTRQQLRDISQEERIAKLEVSMSHIQQGGVSENLKNALTGFESRIVALELTAGANEILKLRKWCEKLQNDIVKLNGDNAKIWVELLKEESKPHKWFWKK